MNSRIKQINICDKSSLISIGRTGENEFRTIEIDVSGWTDEAVEYKIIYSRPDGITYPVPATLNSDILSWTLSAYDVEIVGFGKFEVRAYINDSIGKSATFKVHIDESIQTDETQAGTVRPDWVDDIIDKVVIDSVEQTVTSTEDGGVNILTVALTNGNVKTFEVRNGTKGNNGDKGDKGETGARGETGAQGPQGLQGEKGEQGERGIPGEKGADGTNGADGYTPQRGVDYWTDSDKNEIVISVLNALPNYEEVTF